jgi:hypothetical protein
MKIDIQIIALLFNFLYGVIFYYVVLINYHFIKKEVVLLKIIITLLFLFDFTCLYLIMMYKINYGSFHIYYLLMFVLGYLSSLSVKNRVKKTHIYQKLIDTFKK